jgi:type II secretory pathway pseudopilin PulG
MLVVIAIIAILAGILIPVANIAMNASKRAANGVDIADIMSALDRYKSENVGLYPPSFGEAQAQATPTTYAAMYAAGTHRNTILYRYLLKAYPKISDRDIAYMFTQAADQLDQCSALPFWLNQTSADPRYPFTGATKRSYLAMDERRLVPLNQVAAVPNIAPALQLYGYRPRHAGETMYIYIESRHYPVHVNPDLSTDHSSSTRLAAGTDLNGRAPEFSIRPYLVQNPANALASNPANFVNGTGGYQLHCAGLDERFSANQNFLRKFPCGETGLDFSGAALPYGDFMDERDNQTNFSEGKTISDIPVN